MYSTDGQYMNSTGSVLELRENAIDKLTPANQQRFLDSEKNNLHRIFIVISPDITLITFQLRLILNKTG